VDPTCLPTGWVVDPVDWPAAQRVAMFTASQILMRLTAWQYGLCPIKVRPCRQERDCAPPWYSEYGNGVLGPLPGAGRLYGYGCGCSGGGCGCGALSEIILDPSPTVIVEVRVDGVVLSSNQYRVDDRRKLVRLGGERWPSCQDLALDDTQPGTWSVTYQTGTPPDEGAAMAVTMLAVEINKACSGDTTCKLPKRVTQVVRDGVTYTLLDNFQTFEKGRTGLPTVDMWLAGVNPYAIRSPMRVYSPDTVRARHQTFPTPTLPNPGPVASQSYTHVQSVPAMVWTMVHNLGFFPGGVQMEDNDGNTIEGAEISYPDINTVRAELSVPMTGVAVIS
jgi:hypothetical protein